MKEDEVEDKGMKPGRKGGWMWRKLSPLFGQCISGVELNPLCFTLGFNVPYKVQ